MEIVSGAANVRPEILRFRSSRPARRAEQGEWQAILVLAYPEI
jgi:hypothetical protein